MAAITSVVIYDQVLYQPGKMVWVWVRKVTLRFSREAKRAAPKRTGALARGIRATTPRSGYKTVRGTIRSDAGHTTFVIHGTGPVIRGGGPRGMRVPRSRGVLHGNELPDGLVTYRRQVRGQQANNFFFVAWARTGRAHPAVRGVALPTGLR